MAKLNKKMMLCSIVGGDLADYNRVFEYEGLGDYVSCTHVSNLFHAEVRSDRIKLRPFGFAGKLVGHVGRCPHCGKIYVKIGGEDIEV